MLEVATINSFLFFQEYHQANPSQIARKSADSHKDFLVQLVTQLANIMPDAPVPVGIHAPAPGLHSILVTCQRLANHEGIVSYATRDTTASCSANLVARDAASTCMSHTGIAS